MKHFIHPHEAGSICLNRLLLLLVALALAACHGQSPTWRTGDLVFVEGCSDGAMDQAIMGSTGAMVHVGIIENCNDSIYVIDAAPKTGVSRRSFEAFMEAQKDENGHLPNISVMRLKDCRDAEAFVAKAKSLCGTEYDFTFLPDNGKYYCSELVFDCYRRDGQPVFETVPMNFRNAEGGFDTYWVELFEAQGLQIPQGVSGTNPDDLYHSALLKAVKIK